jgi:nickel-dependent lactate racemase
MQIYYCWFRTLEYPNDIFTRFDNRRDTLTGRLTSIFEHRITIRTNSLIVSKD